MPGGLRRRRLLEEEDGGEEGEAGAEALDAEAEAAEEEAEGAAAAVEQAGEEKAAEEEKEASVMAAEAEEEAEGEIAAAAAQRGEEKAEEEEGRAGVTGVALTSAGLSYMERITLGVDPDLVLQQLPVPLTTHRMQFFPADYFNSSQLKCASRAARGGLSQKLKHHSPHTRTSVPPSLSFSPPRQGSSCLLHHSSSTKTRRCLSPNSFVSLTFRVKVRSWCTCEARPTTISVSIRRPSRVRALLTQRRPETFRSR